MNRVKYFEDTLLKCEAALEKDAAWIQLEWIISQIKYLIAFEKKNVEDFSQLDRIKIGWIAVREMDGYEDAELIHSLCVIAEEVEKMKMERKMVNEKASRK